MSFHRVFRYTFLLTLLLLVPVVAFASLDANSTGLVEAGRSAGLSSICSSDAGGCIASLVGRFLNVVLGFIGLILFGYIVYGGILYMSAAGDDKQVKTAKDTLQNAVVGVFMILLAFGVSSFVLERAIEVTGGSSIDAGGGGGGGGTGEQAGAPGSQTSGSSETGGSICRCTCLDGDTPLAIPVTACNESTCSVTTCNTSCGMFGGSRVAPTCGGSGTVAGSPDAALRAILIRGGDTPTLADGCITAMRRACAPTCRSDQPLQECFAAGPGGLERNVTGCMSGPTGTLPPGGLAPPCNAERTRGAFLLGY